MASEVSFEQASGQQAPLAASPTAVPEIQPKGEISFEEASGPQEKTQSFGGVLKSNVATAAAVGDFVWNFFPLAEGVGRDIGARATAAGAGESRRLGAQAGQVGYESTILPLNPLQKLMIATGYGSDYEKSDVTKALSTLGEWIDKGGDWVEKHTKGMILKEDASSLFNAATLGLLNLRKGGLMKPEPKALEAARRGPAEAAPGARESYYTPAPEVAEATAAVTKPRIKGPVAGIRSVEQTPEAFQIGTVEQPKPPAEHAYTNLPGGTEPVVGQWEGPGGEFTETTAKPGLTERFTELWGSDRRWSARTPRGDESGQIDLELATKIAAAGGLAAWAAANPEKAKEIGLVGGALLAVKGKGGIWNLRAVENLAQPLEHRLAQTPADLVGLPPGEGRIITHVQKMKDWSQRAIRNYLNKHAGTESDPLKDVEIPHGRGVIRWEDLTDKVIEGRWMDATRPERTPGVRPGEKMWEIRDKEMSSQGAFPTLQSYLSHVGDYLRQKVDPAKLQQYDLVRAVKETKKWDEELAAKMNSVEGKLEGTVPFKTYPDKFQWVEVKSPEALKREGDMMGHCVGGYCDYVVSGNTKIYSLRDPKGGSHVTVEVAPPRGRTLTEPGWEGELVPSTLSSIMQIKGKQNRAPSAEYLPYVQDFVKSGKWGEVRDLRNTGLTDIRKGLPPGSPDVPVFARFAKERLGEGPYYESSALEKVWQDFLDYTSGEPGQGSQRGFVDPKLLRRMALLGAGAAVGAYLDQDTPVTGAIVGAAVAALAPRALKATGAAAGQLAKGRFVEAARELVPGPVSRAFATDKDRVKIEKEMNAAELFSRRAELARNRLINQVVELVPDPKGRERIAHFLEGATGLALTAKELAAANSMKRFFGEQGVAGLDAGVLKDTIENYVTHVYGRGNLSLVDAMLAARASGSATTPFAKARTGPPTIAEVNAWMTQHGKKPITADIAKIAEIYGRSLTRAIANKSVLDALKIRTTKILSGGKDVERPLLMRPGKAPGTYEPVGRTGWMAHPDIVPALKFIFSHDDTTSFVRGIEALNTAAKRSAVMLSLFHAKNLVDAFAGASKLQPGKIATGAALGAAVGATQDDPVTYTMIGAGLGMAYPGAKIAAQAAAPKIFGENKYVKALRTNDPAIAKMIDLSFQGGLEYSLKGGGLAVEDIGGAFYQGLQAAQATLDSYFPPAASALKGVEKLNHAMDGFLWERLHTGMKLSIFAEKYETLLQNNAAAHVKDPRVPLMSEEKLAQVAASFTNDIFGGLNWRRVADEAKTKWGAALAQGAYSPTGRRVLQLLMFAPDWTIATTRSAMKAFGKVVGQESGTNVKGLFKPTTVVDLHRQYMLRSAFYYVLIGDGLNVALSGHHLWENKDPTYIEMADGRKIQFSKHTMEPYHWILNPIQQGMNKLGQVPKEVLNQAFGTEYLAPRIDRGGSVVAGPKMEGSRLSHIGRTLNPIGAKQFVEGGVAGGAMGSLGMPIYGKTKKERERIRQKRSLDRMLRGGMQGTRG